MPGFGKSGTSRINDLRWSISWLLSLDSKCRIRPCRLQADLLQLIHYLPLRSGRKIVFESLDATRRSFSKRLDASIRTVAHVTDNLMTRGRALGKETITNSLHFTSHQK